MFDADINTVAATVELHRDAYNAAFYELGLKWHWDHRNYESVLCQTDECKRLRHYLETHQPHLLKAYDAEFLIEAIQTAKTRTLEQMSASGRQAGARVNWAEIQQHQVGA